VAQQIFGGVGFTVEYEIQLYFRRAKALQVNWWNDRESENRIAAAILDRSTNHKRRHRRAMWRLCDDRQHGSVTSMVHRVD
jgi:hypothetical protein